MISIPKLLLIGSIIFVVWSLFKLIDRRRLNTRNTEHSEDLGRPVDTVECPKCNAFVSDAGCAATDCPVRQP